MAVDLNAISESQKNTRTREKVNEEVNLPIGGAFDSTPTGQEGERAYVVFKLVKKRKGRVYVDGICDNVMNPKTKRRERIYLLQGADSIWQSALTELLKDKDYVKNNRRSLFFEDGVMRIRTIDDTALEFARLNTKNVGKQRSGSGKWDFYEYDAAEEQKAALARENKEIEMMLLAKQMEPTKMKKLAAFFGVRFVDDIGMPIGDDGVRTELIRIARRDPFKFEKYIDSSEVEVSWLVKRAILDAKIDLTGQAGNALWADGKGFICKVPADRRPYEYLTELAMTNSDEGRKFKEQLQSVAT